jgi:hypothetical protein
MKFMVLLAVLLAGCGTTRVDAGNERGGTINGVGASDARILDVADAHCRRYGRVGRLSGLTPPRTYHFECVT